MIKKSRQFVVGKVKLSWFHFAVLVFIFLRRNHDSEMQFKHSNKIKKTILVDQSTVFFDTSRLPAHISAPVKKGTVVGQVDLKLAGKVLATVDAVAKQEVKLDMFAFLYMCAQKVVKYLWLIIVVALVLVLILVLISRQNFNGGKRGVKRKIKFKKYDKKKPPIRGRKG